MVESIARMGVMGFGLLVIVALFAFVVVASVLDVPGIRPFDPEVSKTLLITLTNIIVAFGGAAVVAFKGGAGGDGGG